MSVVQRLGAPALITWQRLVFDKDCVAQALRLLLTRIKSSRRISASASASQRNSKTALLEPEDDSDAREQTTPTRPRVTFQTKLRRTVRQSSTLSADNEDDRSRSSRGAAGGWNYDLSTSALDRAPSPIQSNNNSVGSMDNTVDDDSAHRVALPRLTRSDASHRRGSQHKQPAAPTPKTSSQYVQHLERENAALAAENARLQDEVAHLEALTAQLQRDFGSVRPVAALDARRVQLVEVQNLQLVRQVQLLQSAVAETEHVTTSLFAALHRWREVVDAGVQEATAAGADQSSSSSSGTSRNDVKWMLAVPTSLLHELKRLDAQVQSASASASAALEAKLRVSGVSSAYLQSSTTSIRSADLVGSSSSHLRLDRVKALERKLVRVCQSLDAFTATALHETAPRLRVSSSARSDDSTDGLDVAALADATRALLLEAGALGAVVLLALPQPPNQIDSDAQQSITAMHILKALGSTHSSSSAKDREKTVKTMLQQLHAQHAAVENELRACRRETQYWRQAWTTQETLVSALVRRVARLGSSKMQWCHTHVTEPLAELVHVIDAFQHAQLDGSSRSNPYLPRLVDALAQHSGVFADSLDHWRTYAASSEAQLSSLVDDYESNCAVLKATAIPSASHVSVAVES